MHFNYLQYKIHEWVSPGIVFIFTDWIHVTALNIHSERLTTFLHVFLSSEQLVRAHYWLICLLSSKEFLSINVLGEILALTQMRETVFCWQWQGMCYTGSALCGHHCTVLALQQSAAVESGMGWNTTVLLQFYSSNLDEYTYIKWPFVCQLQTGLQQ